MSDAVQSNDDETTGLITTQNPSDLPSASTLTPADSCGCTVLKLPWQPYSVAQRHRDVMILRAVVLICSMYALAVFAATVASHSAALLAIGMRVLTQTLAYLLSLCSHVNSTRKRLRNAGWPYGLTRLDVLGRLLIGASAVCSALFVILQAVEELLHAATLTDLRVEHSLTVLVVAVLGVGFSLLSYVAFPQLEGYDGTDNHSMVMGIACSVLTATSAVIIHVSEAPARIYLDPVAGILIAGLTAVANVPVVCSTSKIVMFVNPCNNDEIEEALMDLPNVLRVDTLKIWQLDSPMSLVATVRLRLTGDGDSNDLLNRAHLLLGAYGIQEATVEVVCESKAHIVAQLQEPEAVLCVEIPKIDEADKTQQHMQHKVFWQPNETDLELLGNGQCVVMPGENGQIPLTLECLDGDDCDCGPSTFSKSLFKALSKAKKSVRRS